MNSGNFPPAKTVQKELGGNYYAIRDIMSELQYKSRMPSTSTGNDTTWDAKLQKNASVNLETIFAIKNSEFATKEEDRPTSALEEKTMDDVANMATLTSETRLSDKNRKLSNSEEGAPTSVIDAKTLSDEITTETSGAAVKVKKIDWAAQQADKPTSALDYKAFSEEIAIPSVTDDNSAETTDERYILKEVLKTSLQQLEYQRTAYERKQLLEMISIDNHPTYKMLQGKIGHVQNVTSLQCSF